MDADDNVRVAIITGNGDKAFCAGADISGFNFDPDKVRKFMIEALAVLAAPENCRKPVISAVNGIAFGGGFELAIASDFIIASDRARFAVPEIKLGLLPGFAIVRLHDMVGRAKAKEMSILGDPISADEAFRLGLVLRVVPHGDLLTDAWHLPNELHQNQSLRCRWPNRFTTAASVEMRYGTPSMVFRSYSCIETHRKVSLPFSKNVSQNSRVDKARCERRLRRPSSSGALCGR